ncbi:MAG: hypothetical protein A2Y73_08020 [Chloroflexi bacterium RBG_13_56_8]|nr:MAG: hypothetical protein A2Y73_08020 [Chloroflexi bacterium RBG_13_56_8]
MSSEVSLVGVLLSIVASVAPTFLYVLVVWWIDRYEKEPLKLLIATFLWGALPAVFVAILLESIGDEAVAVVAGVRNQTFSASFIAPPVEEVAKALSLVAIYYLAREEFDGVLDGIIYGSLVGFGFAATENLLFYLGVWQKGSFMDWGGVVLGRAFVFGLNHAMFTSLTGVGLGLTLPQRTGRRRRIFALLGLSAAVAVHFLHNFFLSVESLCFVSLAADWLGVLVIGAIVALAWRREKSRLQVQLADEVKEGVVTQAQYEVILSRGERLRREWALAGQSGLAQMRLWRRLIKVATELAFAKHRQAQRGEQQARSAYIAGLRAKIVQIRRELGEPIAADSRICLHCGHLSSRKEAEVCPHCGASWS